MEIGYYPGWDSGFVKEYFNSLARDGQRKKAEARLRIDLLTLQEHWPNTLNVEIKMLKGYEPLWELKRAYQGIGYRIFFCIYQSQMWLLHAIEKKSDKTSFSDLELASKRMRDVLSRKVEIK